jgi:hypothetical protein
VLQLFQPDIGHVTVTGFALRASAIGGAGCSTSRRRRSSEWTEDDEHHARGEQKSEQD